uniref:Secreted protein n=1 Tax=Oryza glumipatula TaxID=40148 RepID=A0A0E0AJB4_9ORYZ
MGMPTTRLALVVLVGSGKLALDIPEHHRRRRKLQLERALIIHDCGFCLLRMLECHNGRTLVGYNTVLMNGKK